MKYADLQLGTYIEYGLDSYGKDYKFQTDNCATLSKYKNLYFKGLNPKLVWESLCYQRNKKNSVPWTFVISDLNG